MMDRTILHCDCNSFFASVETVFCPSLAEVPMAVAGDEEARHGIILAKNEKAKKFGIKTAETIWSARKKCPELVLVKPHYGAYAEFSARVRRIYEQYTDLVEPFGMDEAWLDVTGSKTLFGTGYEIAQRIREQVKKEIGITVSVGVSFNKIFAKLGSDYKKPDAVTLIGREQVAKMVYPLPVDSMIFVGRQTAESLLRCNIRTIGELAAASPAFLCSRFGKMGEQLSRYARGEDESPVASIYDKTDPKSVGSGMTFCRDITTVEECRTALLSLAEDVAHRLRKQGKKCTTLSLTIKDPMLKSFSRQRPIESATDLAREMGEAAMAILQSSFPTGSPIRMLTITAMQLVDADEGGEQIGFFDGDREEKREKMTRLETTVDAIRAKYGFGALTSGAVLHNDIGIETGQGSKLGWNSRPKVDRKDKDEGS